MKPRNSAMLAGTVIALAATGFLLVRGDGDAAPVPDADVVVYKSPTCGCCAGWVEHVRENGFTVAVVDLGEPAQLARKKREHGVPGNLASCHTALADGYVVEGHVPAHLLRRLLEERPAVAGLAVPGMPIGSPGMEGPGARPYDVIAIGTDGSQSVYATVDPSQPSSETR